MINEDNVCIRYLMNEMDPSEEVLMERAMMEDDDLLIEVECLRQTLKRLDDLPNLTPPAHITRSIVQQAVEERQRNRNTFHLLALPGFKYAAAAFVVIGATIGGAWLYNDIADTPPNPKSKLSMTRKATDSGSSKSPVSPVTSTHSSNTTPWVDRDNVIYFHDYYRANNTSFDSIIKSSTKKLTPLNDPFYYRSDPQSLQLTGSSTSR